MGIMSVINFNYIKKYKDWTISDFAREFGITPQGARVYFHDRQAPVDLAIKVCEFLDISLDYIYRYELTENYLKRKDPYYIQEIGKNETAEDPAEFKRKAVEAGAVDLLQELINKAVQEAMDKNRKEHRKASS